MKPSFPLIGIRFIRELLVLCLENFLTVVMTASLANTVATNELSALGTLRNAGKNQLPVIGASLVSTSFGNLFLWYCHFLHLLEALNTTVYIF